MKSIRIGVLCLAGLGALSLAACMGDEDTQGPSPSTGTGISLAITVDGQGVPGGFRYIIDRVACQAGEQFDPLQIVQLSESSDVPVPAGSPARKLFAEEFFVVPAGCYNILGEPIDRGDLPAECSSATAQNVRVQDGLTTEVILLLQCPASPVGGLGTAARLNHSPEMQNLQFLPSRYLFECEAVTVCVAATDQDGDGLDFVWRNIGSTTLFRDIRNVAVPPGLGQQPGQQPAQQRLTTQCVEIVPDNEGEYSLQVEVFDLFRDKGQLIRAEEWYRQNQPTTQPILSHDSLQFPLHVAPDVDLLCIGDTGFLEPLAGTRIRTPVAGCDATTAAEFFCDPARVPDASASCPGGTFDPAIIYGVCE